MGWRKEQKRKNQINYWWWKMDGSDTARNLAISALVAALCASLAAMTRAL